MWYPLVTSSVNPVQVHSLPIGQTKPKAIGNSDKHGPLEIRKEIATFHA